jgi:membrane-bound lytic murein transglycosylase D
VLSIIAPPALDAQGLQLAGILVTHHHAHRVGGINALHERLTDKEQPQMKLHLLVALLLVLLAGCATPVTEPTTSTPPGPKAVEAAPDTVADTPPPVAPDAAASAAAAAPAATPVDPLRPEVPVDLEDRSARLDLWDRVRRGFAMPVLDGDLVRQQEQWYATRPDYVQRMTERGSRYLFHIVEEVERRGLPTELALLPFIESAFNPQAISVAKASGMWQFMPATGRTFELTQNVFRDDRRDVLASTRAALDYLTRLYGMFGDWHLALAAYNWGEGNVQRAIARNQKKGLPTDYESLSMPAETRQYVPKLQAVKNIVLRPDAFSITLPALANHPYFLTVPIERDINVDIAAKLAGLDVDAFRQLNPQLNKPVILAAGTPQILLPYDNANVFVRNVGQHTGPLATWTAWVAPKTLKAAEAARQVGMTEAQLREVNVIPPRMLIKAGSTLLVPRNEKRQADVSEHVAHNGMIALAPDEPKSKRVVFKAGKKGDSVAAVARRYRVSESQVAHWNKVSAGARFSPGASIVVYVPQKNTRVAAPAKPRPKAAVPSKPKLSATAERAQR